MNSTTLAKLGPMGTARPRLLDASEYDQIQAHITRLVGLVARVGSRNPNRTRRRLTAQINELPPRSPRRLGS
jgi:hypothetical protein